MKKRGFSCCSFNQPLIREAPEPFSLEIGSLGGSPLGGDFWVFFCPPGWGRFWGCRDILESWQSWGQGRGRGQVLLLAWALSFFLAAGSFRFSGQPSRVHEGLAISSRISYTFKHLSNLCQMFDR